MAGINFSGLTRTSHRRSISCGQLNEPSPAIAALGVFDVAQTPVLASGDKYGRWNKAIALTAPQRRAADAAELFAGLARGNEWVFRGCRWHVRLRSCRIVAINEGDHGASASAEVVNRKKEYGGQIV
jgi:hypothetical protein